MFLRTFLSENDDFMRDKNFSVRKKYNENETSSKESDNTSDAGAKEDNMPNLLVIQG
jgi:hypothetical protein